MSNIQKMCTHCNKIFIGKGFLSACTKECHLKKLYQVKMEGLGFHGKDHKVKKRKLYEKTCVRCKQPFKCNNNLQKYCQFGCSIASQSEEDKIKVANEKWLNPKPKKKAKYSFGQLHHMAEWKRVWDDRSWEKNHNTCRG